MSVRECANIQTFPEDFILDYAQVANGYKMIGNAVPVEFAKKLALQIKSDLKRFDNKPLNFRKKGKLKNLNLSQLEMDV